MRQCAAVAVRYFNRSVTFSSNAAFFERKSGTVCSFCDAVLKKFSLKCPGMPSLGLYANACVEIIIT